MSFALIALLAVQAPPFAHTVAPVTREQLPHSWHRGCPVAPSALRRVRLNVGLGPSTRITVNGRPLALATSPAGVDITRTSRRPLALGSRPSC